jgi:kinetochore protein Mis12/MTW1
VNGLLYHGVSGVETSLLNSTPEKLGFPIDKDGPGLSAAAETEILEGTHALETLLESTVDRNFDKLEIFVLRNILTVPEGLRDWVRLGHYEVWLWCDRLMTESKFLHGR